MLHVAKQDRLNQLIGLGHKVCKDTKQTEGRGRDSRSKQTNAMAAEVDSELSPGRGWSSGFQSYFDCHGLLVPACLRERATITTVLKE